MREIEKGCKVANARCSPKRGPLAPILFSMLFQCIYYKINCTCFRLCCRNEQRSTSTPMVEFAVFAAIGLNGLSRFCVRPVTPMHIQILTVNPIQIHHPLHSPRQPYLQGTRPFGRSHYNVHSSASEASVNSPQHLCVL